MYLSKNEFLKNPKSLAYGKNVLKTDIYKNVLKG